MCIYENVCTLPKLLKIQISSVRFLREDVSSAAYYDYENYGFFI